MNYMDGKILQKKINPKINFAMLKLLASLYRKVGLEKYFQAYFASHILFNLLHPKIEWLLLR